MLNDIKNNKWKIGAFIFFMILIIVLLIIFSTSGPTVSSPTVSGVKLQMTRNTDSGVSTLSDTDKPWCFNTVYLFYQTVNGVKSIASQAVVPASKTATFPKIQLDGIVDNSTINITKVSNNVTTSFDLKKGDFIDNHELTKDGLFIDYENNMCTAPFNNIEIMIANQKNSSASADFPKKLSMALYRVAFIPRNVDLTKIPLSLYPPSAYKEISYSSLTPIINSSDKKIFYNPFPTFTIMSVYGKNRLHIQRKDQLVPNSNWVDLKLPNKDNTENTDIILTDLGTVTLIDKTIPTKDIPSTNPVTATFKSYNNSFI